MNSIELIRKTGIRIGIFVKYRVSDVVRNCPIVFTLMSEDFLDAISEDSFSLQKKYTAVSLQ
jgi:hypothetical protein